MVPATPTDTKKRKPPTFPHLPANRAKKLKRTWVENQKIKSKWKAQKRKEGLITRQPTLPVPAEKGESGDEQAAEQGEEWGGLSRHSSGDEASGSEDAESDGEGSEEDAESAKSSAEDVEMQDASDARPARTYTKGSALSGRGARGGRGRGGERGRGRGRGGPRADNDAQKPSLRELNNLAYSRDSLHTYKSRGRGDRGGRARGARGRGQPDMRLRMNAMLEKIKRDLV